MRPITLGKTCPPLGYYVLYSEDTGSGPYDNLVDAIEHLRRLACVENTAPEFMEYAIALSDGVILDVVKRDGQILTGAYARENYPYPPDLLPRPPRPEIPLAQLPLTITLARDDWITIAYALTFCMANVDEAMLEEFNRREIEASEWGTNEDDGLSESKLDEILDQRMEALENDLNRLKEFLRDTID